MYCMSLAVNRHIDVDIALSFGVSSQTSDTGNRGVVNRFICFEDVTLIDNMRSCCTVSQLVIVNSTLVYSVEVGDIMAIKVKVLPLL